MAHCVYCGLEAYNVMEVRYGRTIAHLSTGADEQDAPREIIGRGYPVCDGCLALLDYRVQHHLDRRRHSAFNALSGFYMLLVVWIGLLFVDLAADMVLLGNRAFLAVGLVLGIFSVIAWLLRSRVYVNYVLAWRKAREKPHFPINTMTGMTGLRDRLNPELNMYLPLQFDDSQRLRKMPGSPPIRSLGPQGEPWGEGPRANFSGSGDNTWYRLVWISWRLWPLTNVLEPESEAWQPPPAPYVTELEVAFATFGGAVAFVLPVMLTELELWVAVLAAFVVGGSGWFVGRGVRDVLDDRKQRRASRLMPPS